MQSYDVLTDNTRMAGQHMQVIPILVVSSSEYLTYAAVMMWSVLESGSAENEYRFYICHCGIPGNQQLALQEHFRGWKNCGIYFISVCALEQKYASSAVDWTGKIPSISVFAGELFPEYPKMLALDVDLIVQRDVAQLFDTDVDNFTLAAAYDLDFIGQWAMGNRTYHKYYTQAEPLERPMEYLQSGVLVLNLSRLRDKFPGGFLFRLAAEKKYRYDDQDIWNLYCSDEIAPLDLRWNVMHDNDRYRLKYVISLAPPALLRQYLAARRDPWIIHYAGNEKPWNVPGCDFGAEYWAVADQTPIAAELRAHQRAYLPPARRFPLLRAAYHQGRYLLQKQQAKRRWPTEKFWQPEGAASHPEEETHAKL